MQTLTGNQRRRNVAFFTPVDRITGDRAAEIRHMNTNLMCSARFQPHLDKGKTVREFLKDTPVGDRFTPTPFKNRHLFPINRVTSDHGDKTTGLVFRDTGKNGQIGFLYRSFFELFNQPLMCDVGFCRHHHA